MPLATMKDLLVSHLNELHANERHLAELLPALAKAASSQELADKLRSPGRLMKAAFRPCSEYFARCSAARPATESRWVEKIWRA